MVRAEDLEVSEPVTRKHSANDVQVYDDLVPETLQRDLSYMLARPIWKYGKRSNTQNDRFPFWCAHFAGGDSKSRESCEEALKQNASGQAFYRLWLLLKEGPLKGHIPLRAYANAHTYGVEGYMHRDTDDPDNYFTTLYYAHPKWQPNWAGETVFFDEDCRTIVKSVYPQPGRVAMFPGYMLHRAQGPSRECAELRLSVVLKTMRAPA